MHHMSINLSEENPLINMWTWKKRLKRLLIEVKLYIYISFYSLFHTYFLCGREFFYFFNEMKFFHRKYILICAIILDILNKCWEFRWVGIGWRLWYLQDGIFFKIHPTPPYKINKKINWSEGRKNILRSRFTVQIKKCSRPERGFSKISRLNDALSS